jgi:hypothetical protein
MGLTQGSHYRRGDGVWVQRLLALMRACYEALLLTQATALHVHAGLALPVDILAITVNF